MATRGRKPLSGETAEERKKKVLDTFLKTLMTNGLCETSVRDLSGSIDLQSGGLYYYYENKDEAVVACAEEAALRLENELIVKSLKDIDDIELLMKNLRKRASKMAPMTRFLVEVSTTPRYAKRIRPVLDRFSERYKYYNQIFADKLECSKEELEPYFYMAITAVSSYMIFGVLEYIQPQIDLIVSFVNGLKK